MAMSKFVKKLSVQPKNSPKRMIINDPEWKDVDAALSGLDTGVNRFFELSESDNDNSVMTVYGIAGLYHIAIIDNETEQSWLMFGPPTEQRVEMCNNQFPMHQVCKNGDLARRLIRTFFQSGAKSEEAEWFTVNLDE